MSREEIEKNVTEIVSAILRCQPNPDLSSESNPEWDSLNHIEIIFSLEEKFEFEFPREKILELGSISSLTDVIAGRLSDQTA